MPFTIHETSNPYLIGVQKDSEGNVTITYGVDQLEVDHETNEQRTTQDTWVVEEAA